MDSNNTHNIGKKDILLFFDTSFKMILYRDRDGITLFLFYLKSTFQKMCPIKQMKIFYSIHHKILFAKRKDIIKYCEIPTLYIESRELYMYVGMLLLFHFIYIFHCTHL